MSRPAAFSSVSTVRVMRSTVRPKACSPGRCEIMIISIRESVTSRVVSFLGSFNSLMLFPLSSLMAPGDEDDLAARHADALVRPQAAARAEPVLGVPACTGLARLRLRCLLRLLLTRTCQQDAARRPRQ